MIKFLKRLFSNKYKCSRCGEKGKKKYYGLCKECYNITFNKK